MRAKPEKHVREIKALMPGKRRGLAIKRLPWVPHES